MERLDLESRQRFLNSVAEAEATLSSSEQLLQPIPAETVPEAGNLNVPDLTDLCENLGTAVTVPPLPVYNTPGFGISGGNIYFNNMGWAPPTVDAAPTSMPGFGLNNVYYGNSNVQLQYASSSFAANPTFLGYYPVNYLRTELYYQGYPGMSFGVDSHSFPTPNYPSHGQEGSNWPGAGIQPYNERTLNQSSLLGCCPEASSIYPTYQLFPSQPPLLSIAPSNSSQETNDNKPQTSFRSLNTSNQSKEKPGSASAYKKSSSTSKPRTNASHSKGPFRNVSSHAPSHSVARPGPSFLGDNSMSPSYMDAIRSSQTDEVGTASTSSRNRIRNSGSGTFRGKVNETNASKENDDGKWSEYCRFCINNREARSRYSTHKLKEDNIITCPVLRKYVCPICGATGDNAHTRSHCPNYKNAEETKNEKKQT